MKINSDNFLQLLKMEHQQFAKLHYPVSRPTDNKWEQFLNSFVGDLRSFVVGKNLEITYSIGKGNWAYIPWIRIAYPEISKNNTEGFFIGYEFGWEEHQAFISLIQGVENLPEENRSQILTKNKIHIQQRVGSGSFNKIPVPWQPKINGTMAKRNRGWSYAEAMIFNKQYNLEMPPSQHQLESDLQEAMDIYDKIRTVALEDREIIQSY